MDDKTVSKILYKDNYTTRLDDFLSDYLGTLPDKNKIVEISASYNNLVVNDFVKASVNIILNNLLYYYVTTTTQWFEVFFFNNLTDEIANYVIAEYGAKVCIQLPFNVNMGFVDKNEYMNKVAEALRDSGYTVNITLCKNLWWKTKTEVENESGEKVEQITSIPIQADTFNVLLLDD